MVKRASTHMSANSGSRRDFTPEQVVAKKLADNFRNFGPEATDVRLGPDGRTLRERLMADYNEHALKKTQDLLGTDILLEFA